MKKVLFAVIFAYATVNFTACESKTSTDGEGTDTTTVAPVESAPEETTNPATTDTTSTDTTAAQ